MKLIDMLPERLRLVPEIYAMEEALGEQADRAGAALEDAKAQLVLDTATWGLDLWEAALGLTTEAGKSLDFRRSRVRSKLRGQGTTTAAMLQNVAESFSNGAVEIIEYPAEARFEVKFVGTVGVPPNMDDLTAAIDDIKPAHLAYTYLIIYRTWDMVAEMTWDQAGAYTWDQLKEGDLS
ncbi:MAG: putative phage tail protein [Pseudoflavonifractor sp.]|nr:putative phage tail protein [Pseudoflavonifractor sp.]